MTEDSFMDTILEPEKITEKDLWKHPTDTEKPYVMFDIEPDMPGVASYAFNSISPMVTMGMRRAVVGFNRIITDRVSKDIDELVMNSISLRDVTAEYQFKQMLRHIDVRGLTCINLCVGQPGQVMATTGSVHNVEVSAVMDQHNFLDSLNIIPKLGTTGTYEESGLACKTLLMNQVTFTQFGHWGEAWKIGETMAASVIKNGLTVFEDGVMGQKCVVSIKRKLIPDGTIYQFADPKFIGKTFVWREPEMVVDRQDFKVSFYVHSSRGGGVFVFGGLAKVQFEVSELGA
jgi:hypothetical protein